MKPRVMTLVVFTGLAGFAAAPVSVNFLTAAIAMLCIAVGAGVGAGVGVAVGAGVGAGVGSDVL